MARRKKRRRKNPVDYSGMSPKLHDRIMQYQETLEKVAEFGSRLATHVDGPLKAAITEAWEACDSSAGDILDLLNDEYGV